MKVAAGGCVAGWLTNVLHADPLGMPIGTQTYPVRQMIATDFIGTIKELANTGYTRIEMCSPVGYTRAGFGDLVKYKGSELQRMLKDVGVKCESSHFSMAELRANLDDRIAWAHDMGLTQMMVPSLGGSLTPTMDDVKRAADEYNKIAAQSAKAGIQQGLHNEGFELSTVDGRRTYDVLFELLDPKLVKFQFQCSTISRGYDAAEYFTKFPGRFISMHLQDWSPETKKVVPVGQGSLDWKRIFSAAKTAGVKNYFVEVNSMDGIKASYPFLHSMST